ncbi:hypothetical protein PCE1_000216 [Barthelona sp. PCE]
MGTSTSRPNLRSGENSDSDKWGLRAYSRFRRLAVHAIDPKYNYIPPETVQDVMARVESYEYKRQPIPENELFSLMDRVYLLFAREKNIIDIDPALNEEPLYVFGDIHGQFEDLLYYVRNVLNQENTRMLFLGDYVDRGPQSIEVLWLLMMLKCVIPDRVFMLKGNHEQVPDGKFDFYYECQVRYSNDCLVLFSEFFKSLPLAAVLFEGEDPSVWLSHASFPLNPVQANEIGYMDRFREPSIGVYTQTIWGDPLENTTEEKKKSSRGAQAYDFGASLTFEFLDRFELGLCVRSHQFFEEGHHLCHDERCLTLFSAPRYCGHGNPGTFARFPSLDGKSKYQIMAYQISQQDYIERLKKPAYVVDYREEFFKNSHNKVVYEETLRITNELKKEQMKDASAEWLTIVETGSEDSVDSFAYDPVEDMNRFPAMVQQERIMYDEEQMHDPEYYNDMIRAMERDYNLKRDENGADDISQKIWNPDHNRQDLDIEYDFSLEYEHRDVNDGTDDDLQDYSLHTAILGGES